MSTKRQADVDRLRELLAKGELSQRAAARELGVDERTMRYWCSGDYDPPAMAFRALDPVLLHRENLKRTIRNNDQVIELLEAGKMSVGMGPELGTPRTAAAEARRLRRKNEELRALLHQEEAFQRRQEAFFAVHRQFLPRESGQPSEDSIAEFDAAEAEWRAAQREVDRIVKEIRAGLR